MNCYTPMEFEWDPDKSHACFSESGFDFAYVLRAFLDENRLIHKEALWVYGEDRYQSLKLNEGRVFFVVYTLRGQWIRIISARKANKREANAYENSTRED